MQIAPRVTIPMRDRAHTAKKLIQNLLFPPFILAIDVAIIFSHSGSFGSAWLKEVKRGCLEMHDSIPLKTPRLLLTNI